MHALNEDGKWFFESINKYDWIDRKHCMIVFTKCPEELIKVVWDANQFTKNGCTKHLEVQKIPLATNSRINDFLPILDNMTNLFNNLEPQFHENGLKIKCSDTVSKFNYEFKDRLVALIMEKFGELWKGIYKDCVIQPYDISDFKDLLHTRATAKEAVDKLLQLNLISKHQSTDILCQIKELDLIEELLDTKNEMPISSWCSSIVSLTKEEQSAMGLGNQGSFSPIKYFSSKLDSYEPEPEFAIDKSIKFTLQLLQWNQQVTKHIISNANFQRKALQLMLDDSKITDIIRLADFKEKIYQKMKQTWLELNAELDDIQKQMSEKHENSTKKQPLPQNLDLAVIVQVLKNIASFLKKEEFKKSGLYKYLLGLMNVKQIVSATSFGAFTASTAADAAGIAISPALLVGGGLIVGVGIAVASAAIIIYFQRVKEQLLQVTAIGLNFSFNHIENNIWKKIKEAARSSDKSSIQRYFAEYNRELDEFIKDSFNGAKKLKEDLQKMKSTETNQDWITLADNVMSLYKDLRLQVDATLNTAPKCHFKIHKFMYKPFGWSNRECHMHVIHDYECECKYYFKLVCHLRIGKDQECIRISVEKECLPLIPGQTNVEYRVSEDKLNSQQEAYKQTTEMVPYLSYVIMSISELESSLKDITLCGYSPASFKIKYGRAFITIHSSIELTENSFEILRNVYYPLIKKKVLETTTKVVFCGFKSGGFAAQLLCHIASGDESITDADAIAFEVQPNLFTTAILNELNNFELKGTITSFNSQFKILGKDNQPKSILPYSLTDSWVYYSIHNNIPPQHISDISKLDCSEVVEQHGWEKYAQQFKFFN
ncbi:hypothetical protein HK103_001053 [Boothiomyces macroporosus]|uniref:Uncharacterized protein n=1 Tax=Boothiomyces macroporosus TaxID=261099 RepID=A0AAD5Y0T0_9FUNG|nr:hypothetical protein HK103_001053 [Boothiomyces macroporosus]